MPDEFAGRVGWLVSWFDKWRGRPHQASSSGNESTQWTDELLLQPANDDDLAQDDRVSESLTARHLKTAVEQLPCRERQVLLLHVNGELTYWQIADQLGLAEQAVLGDLSHAYSQLRVQLSVDELVSMTRGGRTNGG